DVQGHTFDLNGFAQDVTSRAGNIGDNGAIVSGQRVEQTRLSDIRPPGQHHPQAIAQQGALTCGAQHSAEMPFDRIQAFEGARPLEKIDLFLREIQRGLDKHAQVDQLLPQIADTTRELPSEGTDCRARGLFSRRLDQISDCFSLRQIHAPVQKGATRELAWLRHTCAQLQAARQQHAHHHRAAMSLQLENVLAGKGIRCREIQQQALIEGSAVGSEKACQTGATRFRFCATQGSCEGQEIGAGKPYDTDTATTGGGRDRGDQLAAIAGWYVCFLRLRHHPAPSCSALRAAGRQTGLPACLAPSIVRVICHCCAIDRMLLTTQYSTRPDGNHRNMIVNTKGSAIMTLAWIGSGGAGLSLIWMNIVAPITTGSTKYGSIADRSVIQPSHGA